jgi:hypothetical protein
MERNNWFFHLLEEERKTFNNKNFTLLSRQVNAFRPFYELLQEEEASINKRSSARKSVRLRVRALLEDVFTTLSLEVFLLCTLSTSITKLAIVYPKGLLLDL